MATAAGKGIIESSQDSDGNKLATPNNPTEYGKAVTQEVLDKTVAAFDEIFTTVDPGHHTSPLPFEPWNRTYKVYEIFNRNFIHSGKDPLLFQCAAQFTPRQSDPSHPLNIAYGSLQWVVRVYGIESLDDQNPVFLSELSVGASDVDISRLRTVEDIMLPSSYSPTRMIISDDTRLSTASTDPFSIETVDNNSAPQRGFDPITLLLVQNHTRHTLELVNQ